MRTPRHILQDISQDISQNRDRQGAVICRVPRCWSACVPPAGPLPYGRGSVALPLFLAIALLLLAPTAARADQSITVNNINLGIIGEEDFLAGYALAASQAIFWESDVPWRITVRSLDPDLGTSDDGSYIKPLEDLLWKVSDEETWIPMTREVEEIEWSGGADEGAVGLGVIYLDFVARLDWESDIPGQYRARLVFTIEGL